MAHKAGFVNIIGNPNVGKSTLMNAFVGERLSIITSKAQTITDIPGSSNWFERGFVTYSNQSKIDCLKVNADTLKVYGAVSQEVANEMAVGALSMGIGNLSISITGIAGPDGG